MPEIKAGNLGSSGNGKDNSQPIDQAYFEKVYRENYGIMFSVAKKILLNVEDTHDAVQKAFLKFFVHHDQFRKEAKTSSYLCSIVINEALMPLRLKERRMHGVSLEQECEDGSILILEIPDDINCSSKHISKIDIERAASCLPTGQRRVWILYDYLGCKHWEIAQTLGCSTGSTRNQLHKARKKLRRGLNFQQKLVQKKNNHYYNLHDEAASLQQAFLLKNPYLAQYSIL
ncbi:MAG: RNA polymerase sigma factor [Nanoarchaeota archaeon]